MRYDHDTDTVFWRWLHHHQVRMIELAPNVYLGLVQGRRTTSILKVGTTIFILAPCDQTVLSIHSILQQLECFVPDESLQALQLLSETQI